MNFQGWGNWWAKVVASSRRLHMGSAMLFRTVIATFLAAFSALSFAWEISSRELVDVQFSTNNSLIILVSAPGAKGPGIYLWQRDADTPTLLCALSSPTSFSFDRKTIIERVAGKPSELRLYDPTTCQMWARVPIDGKVIDADARGIHIAVAIRSGGATEPAYELRSYSVTGRVLARAPMGRNIEMGFAPDGRSVVNFDLSDGGSLAWHMPTLTRTDLPAWLAVGEATFVPGSSLLKHYVDGTLSVLQWPSGKLIYSTASARSARLRQLSATGRFAVMHAQDDVGEALDRLDFVTAKRTRIAVGSIDHAAISSTGDSVAWALRKNSTANQVQINVARIDAQGAVITQHALPEASQRCAPGIHSEKALHSGQRMSQLEHLFRLVNTVNIHNRGYKNGYCETD